MDADNLNHSRLLSIDVRTRQPPQMTAVDWLADMVGLVRLVALVGLWWTLRDGENR